MLEKIRIELQECLDEHKYWMNDTTIDFVNDYAGYLDNSSYICDLFVEFVDTRIDIYNSELVNWLSVNPEKFDEAVNVYGYQGFYDTIRSAQYMTYLDELNEEADTIIECLAITHILKHDINMSVEELRNKISYIDYNDRLDNIIDALQDEE